MNQATLDKSRQLRIKARINEAGVPLVLTFLNEDGSPHAINDLGWELPLKKAQNTTTNVWKLTEGDGLTIFGDDDNKLRIEVSQDRAEVTAQTYFWTLYSSEEDHTWLNGDWDFHNGVFDGVDDTEDIVIAENGSEITITITGDGGGISTVVVDDVTIQGDGSEDNPLAVKSVVFDAAGAAAGVQTNLTNHENNTSNPHSVTKSQVGLSNVDNTSDANKPVSTAQQAALDLKADLVAGKVPASQLPAYVDDVLEYANFAALPGTGATGIIYVTLDTNLTYRWSGSAYVEISVSLALGETSSTAYRGDRGKTAYDHSQTTGNPHGTVPGDITGFNAAALAAAPAETTTTEGALINGATSKTTPVDADFIGLMDSAASNILKKLSWANIKATLKTYFDTLYPSGSGTSTGTNTGDQTSVSGNAGSATVLQTARNIDGQSFNGSADITVIAPGTHAATGKTTPVDADELPLVDSAASNVLKKLTWANLKATLKTYLDTLYVLLANSATTLTDAATIDLTAIKHTLATSSSRTFTISYTGDDITLEITLSATSATFTLPTGDKGIYNGTPSGTNTLVVTGATSGDVILVAIKKIGTVHYWVGKNAIRS